MFYFLCFSKIRQPIWPNRQHFLSLPCNHLYSMFQIYSLRRYENDCQMQILLSGTSWHFGLTSTWFSSLVHRSTSSLTNHIMEFIYTADQKFVPSIGNIEKAIWVSNCGKTRPFLAVLKVSTFCYSMLVLRMVIFSWAKLVFLHIEAPALKFQLKKTNFCFKMYLFYQNRQKFRQ